MPFLEFKQQPLCRNLLSEAARAALAVAIERGIGQHGLYVEGLVVIFAFRRDHPALRRSTYFNGNPNHASGLPDVSWLEGNGTLLCHEEWHNPDRRHFGALLDAEENSSQPMLLLFNNGTKPHPFVLPGTKDTRWQTAFDTALNPSFPSGKAAQFIGMQSYPLQDRSIACLTLISGRCDVIEPMVC